jgi:hypothetical protein
LTKVFLNHEWLGPRNRGHTTDANFLRNHDVGVASRESHHIFDGEGDLSDPIPDVADRLAGLVVTEESILLDVAARKKILDEASPITIIDDDNVRTSVTIDWIKGADPGLLQGIIEDLAASRDAAVATLNDVISLLAWKEKMLRLAVPRIRALEAARDTESSGRTSKAREDRLKEQLRQTAAELKTAEQRELAQLAAHNEVSDKLAEANAKLIDRFEKIEELRAQLAAANNNARSTTARNRVTIDPETPIDTVETEVRSAGSTSKTAKIADPEKFTDGKAPKLSTWKAALKRKFKGNPELFPSEATKFAYAVSYISGKALEQLEPSLDDEAVSPVDDMESLYAWLDKNYTDPTERDRARNEYDKLDMSQFKDFRDFNSEFNRLATLAQIAEKDWKKDFNRMFTRRLANVMMRDYVDPTIDFHKFQRVAQQLALQQEVLDEHAAAKKPVAGAAKGKDKEKEKDHKGYSAPSEGAGGGGKRGSGTRSATPGPRNNGKEREDLMAAGKCFHCHEQGHIRAQCPKRLAAQIKRIRATQVQEEEDRRLAEAIANSEQDTSLPTEN